MQQINPQSIIDELSARVQQLTLENVVLAAQIRDMKSAQTGVDVNDNSTVVVIGDDIEE